MTSNLLSTRALKTIVAVVVPQGGEGKTFVANTIHTIASYANASIVLGTNDGTNRSLSALLGNEPVADVSWDADDNRGRAVVERQADNNIICVDVGANSDPKDGRFLEFIKGLDSAGTLTGARTVVLVPTATNKAGGLESAIAAATVYQNRGFQVRLVLNDRDGSGNMGDTKEIPERLPIGRIDHLATGLQAYRLEYKGAMRYLIDNPLSGFEMASDRLRNFILRAADSDWAKDVFWWDNVLETVPKPSPDPMLALAIPDKTSVSNASLERNAAYYQARQRFKKAATNSQEFINAAEAFQKFV